MQFLDGLVQLGRSRDLHAHVGLGGDPAVPLRRRLPAGPLLHVLVVVLAEHPPLHGLGEDRVDGPEVRFHLGDLAATRDRNSRSASNESAAFPQPFPTKCWISEFRLAVPVDAANPLLQLVGVERDVVVHQPVAVVLQVDALAGRVGGEQDAHRARWGGPGRRAELFPLVVVHPAVAAAHPLAA